MRPEAAIYCGEVVHARLRPKPHKLAYRVFSMLVDLDRVDELAAKCRLYSHNRFNLFALHDRDHGDGSDRPIAEQCRNLFEMAGLTEAAHRVMLLAYPRVLGSVFNPLSVYLGFDRQDRLRGVVYEVNNTVGERRSYVVSAGTARPDGLYVQAAMKDMYVSPFTPATARYEFRLTTPAEAMTVGVHLRDAEGALLRTHFHGRAETFNDATLAGLLVRFPMQSALVAGAIHIEALRLFMKGVPVVRRHRSPRYAITVVPDTPAIHRGS